MRVKGYFNCINQVVRFSKFVSWLTFNNDCKEVLEIKKINSLPKCTQMIKCIHINF